MLLDGEKPCVAHIFRGEKDCQRRCQSLLGLAEGLNPSFTHLTVGFDKGESEIECGCIGTLDLHYLGHHVAGRYGRQDKAAGEQDKDKAGEHSFHEGLLVISEL
ncbi:hypothetical protein SDC9_58266 [bioreactor metagenome]|uniref:Uncharacterized protein n=1 Tax=bioreactor metagenome TaxID=1076179 RepID=A0A644X6Y5_9ZZZZ